MLNKMYNTNFVVLAASLIAFILIVRAEAAYLEDASLAEPDTSERSSLLEKYVTLWNLLQKQRQERQLQRTDDASDSRLSLMANLLKRGADFRSTRSGGMALCLWKICPAAPWLINK
ncbi:hypothetical protein BsWGS_26108 [Bradybaena similaris]